MKLTPHQKADVIEAANRIANGGRIGNALGTSAWFTLDRFLCKEGEGPISSYNGDHDAALVGLAFCLAAEF